MRAAVKQLTCATAVVVLQGCLIIDLDDDRDVDVEVSELFSLIENVTTQTQLLLENINGRVVITGSSTATVATIAGERRVGSDNRGDATDFLARVRVDIVTTTDELRVRTVQPSDTDGRQVNVDYEVTIPDDLDVWAANINGEVIVLDLSADLRVDLVNGQITSDVVLPPGGAIDLSTVNGSITLDVPTSVSAMLEADVVNGSIQVSGLTLSDATTSSRQLRGRFGAGDGLIDLDTTNGTITIRGR